MELGLTILAGLGAILFLMGYLGFVIAGFKHHFVTGLISIFPVLNIVTVPALWRNTSRKVISAAIGLIIVVASWFLGANTGIQNLIAMVKGDKPTASQPTIQNSNTPLDASSSLQSAKDESKMQALPKKALYRMAFEAISLDKIQTLKDRVVQVTTSNGDKIEGRVSNLTASSITVLGNELAIANIKKVSLMVKKPN
ncbi:MAG: hypothetical protein L3J51_02085 [Cocleimonas sp.]|nr:hypothetical protein [Cocleimonas sp.]